MDNENLKLYKCSSFSDHSRVKIPFIKNKNHIQIFSLLVVLQGRDSDYRFGRKYQRALLTRKLKHGVTGTALSRIEL